MKVDYNQDEQTGWNLEVYQLFCTCDQRIRSRVKGKVCKSKTSIDVQPETLAESESFYSVLLQTQETSTKTYLVAVAEATWKNSPGSNPRCYRFEVWAFSFTSRRLSRISCINEYLAIDGGGNVSE